MDLFGEFELHGQPVKWWYTPGRHYVVEWLGNEVSIGGPKPSEREMTIAVLAYRQGWVMGQCLGRAQKQNEIKGVLGIA